MLANNFSAYPWAFFAWLDRAQLGASAQGRQKLLAKMSRSTQSVPMHVLQLLHDNLRSFRALSKRHYDDLMLPVSLDPHAVDLLIIDLIGSRLSWTRRVSQRLSSRFSPRLSSFDLFVLTYSDSAYTSHRSTHTWTDRLDCGLPPLERMDRPTALESRRLPDVSGSNGRHAWLIAIHAVPARQAHDLVLSSA